jgi:dehydrogenase
MCPILYVRAVIKPLSISLMDLIMKRIRIMCSQQNGPEYLYEVLDFVAQGKVKTIVETYERVAEGRAGFRAVLTLQLAIPQSAPVRTDRRI